VDVAEGQAVGEPAGVGGGRGVGLGRWRCGGVEVGEVEQALLEAVEQGRGDVAQVQQEAEQRHGRPPTCVRLR